jgi:hypothetical protein
MILMIYDPVGMSWQSEPVGIYLGPVLQVHGFHCDDI